MRAASIRKVDYFNYLLHSLLFDIVCITKTWFNSHIDNKFCEISGYNVVRPNRNYTQRGDGIAFYISQGLNYKTVFRSANKSVVKYLGIEISCNNTKCLEMCVYKPHRPNCLTSSRYPAKI